MTNWYSLSTGEQPEGLPQTGSWEVPRPNSGAPQQNDTTSCLCCEDPGRTFQFVLFPGLVKEPKSYLYPKGRSVCMHAHPSVLASLPLHKTGEAVLESQRAQVW